MNLSRSDESSSLFAAGKAFKLQQLSLNKHQHTQRMEQEEEEEDAKEVEASK